jgi:hypothetical protein
MRQTIYFVYSNFKFSFYEEYRVTVVPTTQTEVTNIGLSKRVWYYIIYAIVTEAKFY